MSDYDGFANWGTWDITNIIWGDRACEMGMLLSLVAADDAALELRETVEEMASYEPADGPLRSTLMREGTDNIDWDGLVEYFLAHYTVEEEN